ncbi:MAG: hypothetical protein HY290_33470 [Planctomycetia bacterium]|nr:hypothetical protein [Planctomycetia bacterium]
MSAGFGVGFKQARGGFFDRRSVTNAVNRAELRTLSKFGAFVRTRARTSIRKRRKPSLPGNPPSSHSGLLKRFIFFFYDRLRHSVIVGPVKLNGTIGDAPAALEYGGRSQVWAGRRHRRLLRIVMIRPRPYMQPALELEQPKLPRLWANSVKAA